MRSILLAVTFTLSASLTALAQQTAAVVPETREQAILRQARAAIWGETKVKSLESLALTANRRLARRGNEIEMTLEALFPDKFLQTDIIGFGIGLGADVTLIQAINGDQAWSTLKSNLIPGDSQAWAAIKSGGRDMSASEKKSAAGAGQSSTGGLSALATHIAAELSEMPGDLGGTGASAAGSAEQSDRQFIIQAGFTPLLLVWLLATPPLLPLEFTYAGQAKIQSSGQTADVLDLNGPHNFAARLFIDQQTHQVLMLTYKINLPNRSADKQTQRPADAPAQAEPEVSKVEVRWIASDYRNVNGLTLPHRLTRSTGGQITEEIELQKVKVNPALKPDKFEKKEKK
jgi:hypothetical protein